MEMSCHVSRTYEIKEKFHICRCFVTKYNVYVNKYLYTK